MKLLRVQGTLSNLDSFLDACCMDGRVDLEPATQYMSDALGYRALSEENPYPAIVQRIEEIAQTAGTSLHEEKAREDSLSDETRAYLDDLSGQFARLHDEQTSLQEQQQLCNDAIEQYSHFLSLKANIDEITSCTHVKVRFGFLPLAGYNKLMSSYADDPYILFVPCTQTPEGCWGVYFAPRSHGQEVDGVFSMLYFQPLHVPGAAGSPAEIIEHYRENLEVVGKSLEELQNQGRALWMQNQEKVQVLYDTVCYRASLAQLRSDAAVKGNHFFCVGWVPAAQADEVAARAKAIAGLRVTVDEPEKASRFTPPTKLRNPWWSRPFEFLVEMYGLPQYDETDVTGFVALTFTILFGIMFGDVGQGVVLTLFSLVMWKFKRNALFHMMIPCGIASTIAGFVYGSFFGYEDVLDPLYHALGMASKPVSVMDSINGILITAVYIGVALVIAAICLNIYTNIKKGSWGDVLFSTNGVIGLLAYLGGVDLVSAYMGATTFMPAVLAVVLMVAGLVVLLFQEVLAKLLDGDPDWRPESGWGNFIMQSFFELLESVLSYLSNTISFLRVGAFVIVHASMMTVVFTLAGSSGNLAVVAVGNVVVIALEATLSTIQGIRLEFYEMFSRCYKGGGRKFAALNLQEN